MCWTNSKPVELKMYFCSALTVWHVSDKLLKRLFQTHKFSVASFIRYAQAQGLSATNTSKSWWLTQESISSNQRGRSYEQPDFVQGQVGQNLSLLREKLGRKLGYSIHVFRISALGSEDNIYNEYYRRLNRQFRQITKNKPSFTNDDSLRKMLYLASQKIVERWTQRCRNWDVVLSQLLIIFDDRISAWFALRIEFPVRKMLFTQGVHNIPQTGKKS